MNGTTGTVALDFVALNEPSAELWQTLRKRDPRALREDESLPRPLRAVLSLYLEMDTLEKRRRSNALLVHFLSRSAEQRLALARAVVEWARQRSTELEDWDALKEVDLLLADPDLEALGPVADLRALVAAYQADDQSFAGDGFSAESALTRLRRNFGEMAPEIRALILEVSADVSSRLGFIGCEKEARRWLEQAETLLDVGDPIPGRRAQLLLRRGRLALRTGEPIRRMRSLLESAWQDLPIGVDVRMRLEVHSCLGSVQLLDGDVAAAEVLMSRVEAYYEMFPHAALLQSQRLRLQGQILMDTGRHSAAEPLIERSLMYQLEQGSTSDAFRAFGDLLDIWENMGQPEHRRPGLERLLRQLIAAPDLCRVGYVATMQWLRRAEGVGLDVPDRRDLPNRLLPRLAS